MNGRARQYPKARDVVDGLAVRDEVPNMDSIGATFYEYTVLDGIRAVPMSDFDSAPHDMFYAPDDIRRSEALAEAIHESGEIAPLIVVLDEEDMPYILEGAHRLAALHILDVVEFPALVVIDEDGLS